MISRAHDFYYGRVTLKDQGGGIASLDGTTCIASSPAFTGNAPWTLTVSKWTTGTLFDTSRVARTVTFDPETDFLLAPAVTVSFEIDPEGKTCAPDCDDPWTGGSWPLPPQPSAPNETTPSSSSVKGLEKLAYGGIIAGSIIGFLIVCCGICCCCMKVRRSRKRSSAVDTEEPSEVQGETSPEERKKA